MQKALLQTCGRDRRRDQSKLSLPFMCAFGTLVLRGGFFSCGGSVSSGLSPETDLTAPWYTHSSPAPKRFAPGLCKGGFGRLGCA
eukprot:scaffold844_cov139-Isochrysis_galbana.AAC.9